MAKKTNKSELQQWISKLSNIQKVVYPLAVGCFVMFWILSTGEGIIELDTTFFKFVEFVGSKRLYAPKYETIIPFGLSIVFALIGYFSPKK